MALPSSVTRRTALKKLALAGISLHILGTASSWAVETIPSPMDTSRTQGLKVGVASYSLRKLSIDDAIAGIKQLNVGYVSVFRAHVPIETGTVEECRIGGQKFKDAGLTLTSTGVVNLFNDEISMKKAFDNARAAGLPMMTVKPALDSFPLLDKFVKDYDIKVAIHNHGPEDAIYPSPYNAWKVIQDHDKRIGLCIDVGHTSRFGENPVEAIKKCKDRLYDLHLKDSLAALPGLAESVGYVRGMLAGM